MEQLQHPEAVVASVNEVAHLDKKRTPGSPAAALQTGERVKGRGGEERGGGEGLQGWQAGMGVGSG